MTKDSGFRWDPWLRCSAPNEMKLELPHDYKGIIKTACHGGRWFYGYYFNVFQEAWLWPRAKGEGYGSEREAKLAALTDFLQAVYAIRQDIYDEDVCIMDAWDEIEVTTEELLEWMDDVVARIEEYRELHDEDVIFEFAC